MNDKEHPDEVVFTDELFSDLQSVVDNHLEIMTTSHANLVILTNRIVRMEETLNVIANLCDFGQREITLIEIHQDILSDIQKLALERLNE